MEVPKYVFFTKGVGIHKDKLISFELALRQAGIAPFNLIEVSSILPPNCKIISKRKGMNMLSHGQLLPVVLSRNSTNTPKERISAAIGIAKPKNANIFGYIAEYSSNENYKTAKKKVEELAVNLLASASGMKVLKPIKNLNIKSFVQTATGHKNKWWTTVIAAAVFV